MMKKKMLAGLLTVCMLLTLTACGGKTTSSAEGSTQQKAAETETGAKKGSGSSKVSSKQAEDLIEETVGDYDETIVAKDIDSITFSDSIQKEYCVGDDPVLQDISFTVNYKDGTSGYMDTDFAYEYEPFYTAGTKTVTVYYKGVSNSFDVNVVDVEPVGIRVDASEAKTQYSIGDTLDRTGIVVYLLYNDGTEEELSSDYSFYPTTFTEVVPEVTVTYGTFTAAFNVHMTIEFGSYEQDNDESNGQEPIEWLVLDVDRDKALVISKYALEKKAYNGSSKGTTWETCDLREWLNNTFYDTAFTDEEKSQILTTDITAEGYPDHDTNPGNDTQDKVFCLSISEAETYFASDYARRCAPTAYTKAKGIQTTDYETEDGSPISCSWWLRNPGSSSSKASTVSLYFGGTITSGDANSSIGGGVRPAMWIYFEQ